MKSVPLTAYPRTATRRGNVKRLRTDGRVPAVIYGGRNQPQNLEVTLTDIENLIHHSVNENVLVDLSVDSDPRPDRLVLVQDVQHHVLTGKVLHVDLHEVSPDEMVSIMVPVETTGEAVGVKTGGGVLEHVLFKVKVRSLPRDLPQVITVDVTDMQVGQTIHIGDIKAPEGVEILGEKTISVISVAAPLTETEEAAAGEAPSGEVEMIKEKKDDAGAKGGDKKPAAADKKPADKKK